MLIIKSASKITDYLNGIRAENLNVTIGFIPTMGALHSGHMSLIDASVRKCDITVCSIFVNPTQFGEKNDLEKYPKPIENDIEMLIEHGCSVLFLPEYEEVYPKSYQHQEFNIGDLAHKIEGESRPGHFQGVCNVLFRFFTILSPDVAFFGQKDFQQTAVVNRLAELMESDITISVEPIVREPHGLAMSSRNVRLSEKGRMNARFIYKALQNLKEDVESMTISDAIEKAKQFINANKGAEVDYLTVVDTRNLNNVDKVEHGKTVVLTVVEYEGVRLLDNLIL